MIQKSSLTGTIWLKELRLGDFFQKWLFVYNPNVQRSDGWLGQAHPSVFAPVEAQWMTSTPGRQDKLASFDGGRVRAWLGVQSPAPQEERTSCSKAVQTEEVKVSNFCQSLFTNRDIIVVSSIIIIMHFKLREF